MARVFISYRRRDNPLGAEILRDALQERFGIDEVFFDLDNIPFGVDFRQYISNAVGSCAVLLVVIGDRWLHLTDEQGRRRLEDPSDFVRIEIEAALKRGIPIVPVLIDTAQMPAASELPESIRELTFRNAAEMRAGRDRKHHVERLVSGLAESLEAISRLAEEDSAPSEEEVPVAPKRREEITRPTEGTPAAGPNPIAEPTAAAKDKISRSKEKKATNGDTHLGGDDWDARIMDWIINEFKKDTGIDLSKQPDAVQRIKQEAEKAKIALSSTQEYEINLPFITADASGPKHIQKKLTRSKMGQLCDDLFQRTIPPVGSVTSAEKGSVAPKAREKITHQAKVKAVPAKPSAPVTVAEAQQLSPSVLQERAAFVEKTRKAFEGVTDTRLYFAGTIPVETATAATAAYAPDVPSEDIMLLYDGTIFSGAEAGVLLTTDSIYWHNPWADPGSCRYADIRTAIVNTSNNLLINGDKEVGASGEIAQGLMKLLIELLPDLQVQGAPAEESAEPISQSISAEKTAFLEKCRPLQGISNRLWLKGEIPAEKARVAAKRYAPWVPVEAIMLLYDGTVFGGAKDGLLLTVDSIYWHNKGEEAKHCRYSDIKDLSISGSNVMINGKKINMVYGGKAIGTLVDLLGRLKA